MISKDKDIVCAIRNYGIYVGCSPIKALRELGSDRRETGWSLSTAGVES